MVDLEIPGFPGGSDGKESACNREDPRSILGSETSPGEGNGNPCQYSCLENSVDREARQATVPGVSKQDMTNTFTFNFYFGDSYITPIQMTTF